MHVISLIFLPLDQKRRKGTICKIRSSSSGFFCVGRESAPFPPLLSLLPILHANQKKEKASAKVCLEKNIFWVISGKFLLSVTDTEYNRIGRPLSFWVGVVRGNF